MAADTDEEACRRLMIFLFGSEAATEEMRNALLEFQSQVATPEQEKLIRQHYQASRDAAREAGSKLDIQLHPILVSTKLEENAVSPMTPEQEKEFDELMDYLYQSLSMDPKNKH